MARRIRVQIIALLLVVAGQLAAQVDAKLTREMRWRMIGPFRGGRTKAAAGVPGQPNVFYIGAVNGGVWKTTDYGRTWVPIFDDQPTGSIGAISVAPSDPNVIYVGSGEGLQRPDLSTGDGIYKSVDAGRTWRHLGLRDGQQIPQIAIDPRDPNRLFVAVLGHPYGPNDERGLFRSTDGGETFHKVLYKDENTGAVDVVLDPTNPDVLYAVLWQARQAPWENGAFSGPGSGLFKSTDGGNSWKQLTKGLPTFDADGLGRMGITVAPSDPNRLFATVATRTGGWLYRSDDAGESWRRASDDRRIAGRPDDFAEVKVHPTNPDIVFTANVVTWKSIDGAKTFTAIRGAPGGDDYHRIWINPDKPEIFLIASDQGAIITVNGGETFSSWYNQPTAQFYHVTTDNAFPYRVCGGQQESGSACVASRGDDGQITFHEFHPVAVEEYGYVAADPLDPDIVYGGKLTRYDRRTAQVQNVAPKVFRSADYRALRTAPVVFSPLDPKTLYFATNTLWKTSNGGHSWAAISPDLTRRDSVVSPSIGIYGTTEQAKARHPGVIYAVAPSPKGKGVIWAGSDDGLIHVTMNGGRTWKNVTPAELVPWSKVSVIDASAHDSLTAYAAINTLRLSELTPHIYRTRDGGKTWAPITNGLPNGATINAVRADPKRAGLLFAGSETAVYYSIDDGEHWQSLRLNMPATSIRDLVIKDDDLVVGTHGRGFWILDDITPLRQLTAATALEAVTLFRPQVATRARWTQWPDTPLPQEEPTGKNPPDGASISYYLKEQVSGSVTLEVLDRSGTVIRRYSSDDPPQRPIEGRNIPDYWIKPPQVLSTAAGMHRFYWDMRTPPPAVLEFSYPISGISGATPQVPLGVWVLPGSYTVKLMAGGATRTAPLTIRMDPRVKAGPAALQEQFGQSMRVYQALRGDFDALTAVRAVRRELEDRRGRVSGALTGALDSLGRKLADLENGAGAAAARGRSASGLARLNGELAALFDVLQDVDAAPTTQATDAIREKLAALASALAEWNRVRTVDVSRVNAELRQAGFEPIGASR